jgi:hypothetical protein
VSARSLLLALVLGSLLASSALFAPRASRATQDQAAVPAAPAPFDVSRWRAEVERIVAAALECGEAPRMLRELCTLAPHRLAGSPGAERAVEWALAEMQRLGFENVRKEPCLVPRWERGAPELCEIVAPEEARGERLRILALGGSVGTPEGGLEADIVRVTTWDELAAAGERAHGRIVFFDRPMDPRHPDTFQAYGGAVDQRARGASAAARAGGVAALVRSMTLALDDAPHTGALHYEDGVERVPAAALSTLAARRLAELCARGAVRVRLVQSCRTLADVESANVVGELVGRELPDEVLVVGGHLDAWDVGQGAHDDGAGCVQSIEALRLLKQLGLRPRRTLRAVMFMNEENGTRGAQAYFAAHRDDMARHVLALESDRGGSVPRGFTTDANPRALETLRAIGALLRPAGIESVDPGYGGVDIAPMAAAGVVLVGLRPDSQRYFDVHHSENDVLAAVHPRELELGAAAMAALLYVAAELPEALPRNGR